MAKCLICRKRPPAKWKRGLCEPCYRRDRNLRAARCKEYGCDKPARARGLCETHYAQLRRSGTKAPLVAGERKTKERCSVTGCRALAITRGLCRPCYQRRRRADEAAAASSAAARRRATPPPPLVVREYGGADTPLEVFMARQRAALASTGMRRHADFYG